jgi:hypothetical protein
MIQDKKSELEIILEGYHNSHLEESSSRIVRGNTYKESSIIWIIPTRGVIPAKIVSSIVSIIRPMNQKFFGPLFIENMEVGDAYQRAVELILGHPDLSQWKYLFTSEEDNILPQDTLLRLLESVDKYDAISGLYWTKGEGGQPMCYGDPTILPKNFIPQPPPINCVKEYNGLGMGCCLIKIDMLKKIQPPWFKTVQSVSEGLGTQDLYFFQKAGTQGYKFAVDGRVKSGHLDVKTGIIW